MALGPNPFEAQRNESVVKHRMLDQIHFLGDMGRSQQPVSKEADSRKKAFQKLIKEELGEEDEPDLKSAVREKEDNAQKELEQKEQTAEDNADVDRMTREGGLDQATKVAHGNHWQGPNPLLALGVVPQLAPFSAQVVAQGGRSESGRSAQSLDLVGEEQAKVDPSLLRGLRDAGLRTPLTGLLDPRLARDRERERLREEGWKEQELAGGSLYTWELPGGSVFQRLRWSEGDQLLETCVREARQVLQKKGAQYFAKWSRSSDPQDFRPQ